MPCNSYPAIGHISGFDGESVVVTPGAFMGVSENRGSVIAFDALTGEEHWRGLVPEIPMFTSKWRKVSNRGPNASWTGPRTPGMTVWYNGLLGQATPMGSAFLHGALAAAPKMLAVSTCDTLFVFQK
eukprot:g28866.t1